MVKSNRIIDTFAKIVDFYSIKIDAVLGNSNLKAKSQDLTHTQWFDK